MAPRLRIGSRPSQLALAQARLVRDELGRRCPQIACEIVPISTTGDRLATPSLAQVGGKGLFVRELETALAERRIDLAVHSMKDLPAITASGMRIVAVPPRESCADVLIARFEGGLDALPRAARVGTSSARRRYEILRIRPDLDIRPLRGNVDTRTRKLQAGDFDAIILAAAGLKRLGAAPDLPMSILPEEDFIPAGGQGALAIEALADEPFASAEIERALIAMDDICARCEISAERAYLAAVGASCASPVGVRAIASKRSLIVRALLFSLDGGESMADMLAVASTPHPEAAARAGEELGRRMLANGAAALIGHGIEG